MSEVINNKHTFKYYDINITQKQWQKQTKQKKNIDCPDICINTMMHPSTGVNINTGKKTKTF